MAVFVLELTDEFINRLKKLAKNNFPLQKKIKKALQTLASDPSYPSLKTHKVQISDIGDCWSSWVTGDIRMIWLYKDGELVILCLTIGGHSGSKKVYR